MAQEPRVIATVFCKQDRHRSPEDWQKVANHIQQEFQSQDNSTSNQTLQTRFLDQVAKNATTGRVAEISIPVPKPLTLAACKTHIQSLQTFEVDHALEIVAQPSNLHTLHKTPGLAIFDMDSTLIQQEVIDELARAVGCYDAVSAITEAAMRGEEPYTDFEASLRARVALLKGVPTSIWEDLKREGRITFTPGAAELVGFLRGRGWRGAVLSGGFVNLAEWVKETLGLDYAFANHLVADEMAGVLTGELVPGKPIIHGEKKRELLLEIAQKEGIERERVVAVGDGSNDLPMMGVAGLGVAFNAKPKVQAAAPVRLNERSLRDVLYVLGFDEGEIRGVEG
ncbi:hypothetical protein PRZ48_013726 [Zasmidium cellare]|uniref:phosphoserine phosphatase n=1 Tax=Zasmidium cellare TaxID=395010 RepID=A0ABR0E1W7_ZASCE|nr:hypothetical protein PRZ48_013726 [Zasmidium cellare]